MSNLRTCDDCGETFPTITRCRLHDCPESVEESDDQDLTPDYQDPFAPSRTGEREMRCLHCEDTFSEQAIVFEHRHGSPDPLWWCPNPECDGAGVGYDIHPV